MAELRPEAWSWHLLGLLNPLIVIGGNIVGGYWVAAGAIFMLGNPNPWQALAGWFSWC